MSRLLFFALVAAFLYWTWSGKNAARGGMSRAAAARLLGIAEDADASTIHQAHKRLISRVHPDAGGSADLAAQVNLARDILLQGAPR